MSRHLFTHLNVWLIIPYTGTWCKLLYWISISWERKRYRIQQYIKLTVLFVNDKVLQIVPKHSVYVCYHSVILRVHCFWFLLNEVFSMLTWTYTCKKEAVWNIFSIKMSTDIQIHVFFLTKGSMIFRFLMVPLSTFSSPF